MSLTALSEGPPALDARPPRPTRGGPSHPYARISPQTSATPTSELTYTPHERSRLVCHPHTTPVPSPGETPSGTALTAKRGPTQVRGPVRLSPRHHGRPRALTASTVARPRRGATDAGQRGIRRNRHRDRDADRRCESSNRQSRQKASWPRRLEKPL